MDAVILAGRQTARNRTLTSPCSIERRKAAVLITVRHRTEALRCRETPQNTDTSKRTLRKLAGSKHEGLSILATLRPLGAVFWFGLIA
jgi:hypothetical protein